MLVRFPVLVRFPSSALLERKMSNCFQFRFALWFWSVLLLKIKISCANSETNCFLMQFSILTIFAKYSSFYVFTRICPFHFREIKFPRKYLTIRNLNGISVKLWCLHISLSIIATLIHFGFPAVPGDLFVFSRVDHKTVVHFANVRGF